MAFNEGKYPEDKDKEKEEKRKKTYSVHTVRMPIEKYKQLRDIAWQHKKSINELTNSIINEFLLLQTQK